MKIIKNKPIPETRSKFNELLNMEVGDCAEINSRQDFESAMNFLRKHFKIKTKQANKDFNNYVGLIWRVG
jgi:hypothetical protein